MVDAIEKSCDNKDHVKGIHSDETIACQKQLKDAINMDKKSNKKENEITFKNDEEYYVFSNNKKKN